MSAAKGEIEGVSVKAEALRERLDDALPMETAGEDSVEVAAGFLELFHNHPAIQLLSSFDTGVILDANESACEFYGYSCDELVKLNITDLNTLPLDSLQDLLRGADAVQGGKFNMHHRLASGEIRDVISYAAEVTLFARTLVWSTVIDVTEESQNRRVRALLPDISEAASVADDIHAFIGLVRDRLGDFLDTTNFYVALYDEAEGIYHFPFYADEKDPIVASGKLDGSITDYIRRTGRSLLVDAELERELTEMGEIRLIGTSSPIYLGVPLKTPHGVIGVIAVQHYEDPGAYRESDLDLLEFASGPIAVLIERLRAESALRYSEANFRTFIQESPQGIVFTDPNDILLTINDEFQRIFGYHAEELIGRPNQQIVPDEYSEESESLVVKAREQDLIKLDTTRRAKDGRDVEVSILGVPIHREGKHIGTYWVYRDLTEQRRSEALQSVLFEITKAATTRGDLNDVMMIVHQQISKLIEASNFFVALYDTDNEEYYFPYFVDEEEEIDANERFTLENSMTDFVRRCGSTLLRSEQDVVKVADREGIQTYPPLPKSWLGVQLKRPDRVIGVVVVQSYKYVEAYDERDRELLEFVSGHIASVIEHKREQVALRESEERHRALFNQSPVGVLLYDKDLLVTDCNDRHAEIMGAKAREELIGISLADHRRKDILYLMKQALKGESEYYEGPYQPKRAKQELWLSMSFSPYYGSDREILGGMVVVMDNTVRKRAEEKEAELNRAYLEQLFEGAPEAIVVLDPDLQVIKINQEFSRLFGYSEEESVGADLRNLILPDQQADGRQHGEFLRLQQGYLAKVDETQCRRKDGSSVDVSLLGTPIEIDQEIVGLYAIYRDITKRKQATDELAAEKERLAVTLASLGEGVITTDIDGRVAMMNEQAVKLTGWTSDLAIGQEFETIFPLRDEQTGVVIESPANRVIDSGVLERWSKECILHTRDGGQVLIVGSATPVHNRDDDVIGAVVVFRDVSQQRKMEEEVAKIERLESVGVLAGGIAHDFNNILSAVLGNISIARLVQDDPSFTEQRLEDAEKATLRARELTQQLLTFSKGGQPVRKAASISELVRESAEFTLRGSNVRCEFEIDEELWSSEVDENQISRVINNLVLNADQAMSESGNLWIRGSNLTVDDSFALPLDPGRYVKVEVEDNGPGISGELLQKIFDPFFTTKPRGSGLGLATSFSIVQKHDGLLTVDSAVGEGTKFTIYLPGTDKEVVREQEQAPLVTNGRGRILIMDDEPFVREVATVMLKNLGFEAVAVPDGEAALKQYEEAHRNGDPFDVVIMDLTIPGGMGGEEAMRKLKEFDPDVRGIVSSGYSNDPVMADHRSFGFAGVVAKPYLVEDLQRVLHEVLD